MFSKGHRNRIYLSHFLACMLDPDTSVSTSIKYFQPPVPNIKEALKLLTVAFDI